MSTATSAVTPLEKASLDRLSHAIRGKLQFMDYLVRAAATDLDRYTAEPDPGTRLFLKQLVEMHASSLALEAETMRLIDELCANIDSALADDTAAFSMGDQP